MIRAFAVVIALIIVFLFSFGDVQYNEKWFVYSVFSALLFALYCVRPRLGTLAAGTCLYILCNAAWFWIWSRNRYYPVNPYDQMGLRFFISDGVGKFFIVFTPLLMLAARRRWLMHHGATMCAFFTMANLLVLVAHLALELWHGRGWCTLNNSCGGIMINPSMNGCMLAATLPLVIRNLHGPYSYLLAFLSLCAIFFSNSSIAIGMLGIGAVAYLFLFIEMSWQKKLSAAITALLILAAIGFVVSDDGALNPNGRTWAYQFFMGKWLKNPINIPFGVGFGTFGVFSQNLQGHFTGGVNGWWLWLHSDWLQSLFELGVIGFISITLTYFYALARLYWQGFKHEFLALLMYGAMAAVNYPVRLSLSAALGAWLMVVALAKEEENTLL